MPEDYAKTIHLQKVTESHSRVFPIYQLHNIKYVRPNQQRKLFTLISYQIM